MKKALLILTGILVILFISAYVFRAQIFFALMGSQIAPEQSFAEQVPPPAPDYADDTSWAALPTIDDPSDQMPTGVSRDFRDVAVFFVHPTSYFGKTWNQPLDDKEANWLVDERILRHQATVFNSCCDIYAPRYRQATFFSFMDPQDNGEQALTLAYEDVVNAFNNFLSRIGPNQPFILAGHSQGTRHATQLLTEHIDNTKLTDRLVATYLIGFSVSHDQLGGVPACGSADQIRCAVGWNAMDGEGDGAFGGIDNPLCTNPLTWRNDNNYAAHNLNLGAIGYPTYGRPEASEDYRAMTLEVGIADAQCVDGQLAVQDLRSESFPSRMLGNSMHIYDYSLYHMNIRQNVQTRIDAFSRLN
jgi:pimeloyl-ACP methyl ester carboxylesterase